MYNISDCGGYQDRKSSLFSGRRLVTEVPFSVIEDIIEVPSSVIDVFSEVPSSVIDDFSEDLYWFTASNFVLEAIVFEDELRPTSLYSKGRAQGSKLSGVWSFVIKTVVICVSPTLFGVASAVEPCPTANEGKPFTLHCSGSTSSHDRVVNWERETRYGYMTTLSSCSHNPLTPDCRNAWTPCEISYGIDDRDLYSVETCIRTVDEKFFFSSNITIKEVPLDMDDLIFQCKVLDREAHNIFPKNKCRMNVRQRPSYREKGHGTHQETQQEINSDDGRSGGSSHGYQTLPSMMTMWVLMTCIVHHYQNVT